MSPGIGPPSDAAASPEAQANGPPKVLHPGSLCAPPVHLDGRGIRFHPPPVTVAPARGSAVCVWCFPQQNGGLR